MRVHHLSPAWVVVALISLLLLGFAFMAGQQPAALASPGKATTLAATGLNHNPGQPAATVTPCTMPFVDLDGDPYYAAIQYVYCAGAIEGTDAAHFSPTAAATFDIVLHALDVLLPTPSLTPTVTGCYAGPADSCTPTPQPVTRGEIARIIIQRLGVPLTTPTGGVQDFTDVPPSFVFYTDIETIYHLNIMGGYPDGTFRPSNPIQRDEFCQILYNAVLYAQGTPLPTWTATPTITATPQSTSTPVPTATPTDCANPFVDITGNIFYQAIHLLNCEGVINGTDATHYSPAGTATRGQLAKVVVLGFNIPPVTPGGPSYFNCQGYFACIYLETLHAAGIFDGYSQQQCQDAGVSYPCALPNRPITRAQLTKMVVLAGHYPLYTPSGGPDFIDVPITDYWAYVYIETAYHYGIINGYPGHLFRPNANIRRDDMAQIVYKGILNKP